LGVSIGDISKKKAKSLNISSKTIIKEVMETGPAADAKLLAEDIILEFNGIKIVDPIDIIRLVSNTPPGTVSKLKVLRNETDVIEVDITVEEKDPPLNPFGPE
jgi:serine protease Do